MAATIKDVAKMAGLSIATVSKYINGGHVIDANRLAIEDAINKLDYRVNTMARGLKTRKTKSIGVLIPSVRMIFCMDMISAVEAVLGQEDFSTLICDCQGKSELEEKKMAFLLEKQVDGIITMPFDNSSIPAQHAIAAKVPIVLVDRKLPGIITDCVLVNNSKLACEATTELLNKGHERIGIICGPADIFTTAQRLQGYNHAYQMMNKNVDLRYIRYSDYSMEGGYRAFNDLLEMSTPPTAILATNYETTMGSLMALNRRKIQLPYDLSFVGFDGLDMASLIQPDLTMAIQPVQKMGEQAAKIMLERLKPEASNSVCQEVILDGKLIRGNSTAKINF